MAPSLHKGQKGPLTYIQKARHRIIVGLSWDPREDEAELLDTIRGQYHQHDLDLSCYIYDQNREFLDFVSAEASYAMDESGKIYHSGDDVSGDGDGDDETIAIELSGLPDDIHHIVFLVEVKTNHIFANVLNPYIRIADGMSDADLLTYDIAQDDDGKNAHSLVFARIFKDRSSPTGWGLHNIGAYPITDDIDNWGDYLKQYLD